MTPLEATNVDKSVSGFHGDMTATKIMIRIPRSTSLKTPISSPLEGIHNFREGGIEKEGPMPKEQPSTRSDGDWRNASLTVSESVVTVEKDIHLGCIDYEPFKVLFPNQDQFKGATVDVSIPSRFLHVHHNPALRKRYLYGGVDGIYTDDSDAVAILQQQGVSGVSKGSAGLKATFMVLPRLDQYEVVEMNGIKSRSWKHHTGLSIRLIKTKSIVIDFGRKKSFPARNNVAFQFAFSPTLGQPTIPLAMLPMELGEDRFAHMNLILEGPTVQYTLHRDDQSGKFRIQKTSKTGMLDLFKELDWREIGWNAEGLAIHKTRLRVSNCYWRPKDDRHM